MLKKNECKRQKLHPITFRAFILKRSLLPRYFLWALSLVLNNGFGEHSFYLCQIKIVVNYNFQGTFHDIVSDLWAEYKIFVFKNVLNDVKHLKWLQENVGKDDRQRLLPLPTCCVPSQLQAEAAAALSSQQKA